MEPFTLAMIAVGAYLLMSGKDEGDSILFSHLQNAENELKKLEATGKWDEAYFNAQLSLAIARFKYLQTTLKAAEIVSLQQQIAVKHPTLLKDTDVKARIVAAKAKWGIKTTSTSTQVITGATSLYTSKGLLLPQHRTSNQVRILGK